MKYALWAVVVLWVVGAYQYAKADETESVIALCSTMASIGEIVQDDRHRTGYDLPTYIKAFDNEIPDTSVEKGIVIQVAIGVYATFREEESTEYVYDYIFKDCVMKTKYNIEDLES